MFLALPSVFLAWSLITFIVAILAFAWTTGTSSPLSAVSTHDALGPRIVVTVIFGIGALYFILVVMTFKTYAEPVGERQAGEAMRAWASSPNPRTHAAIAREESGLERGEVLLEETKRDKTEGDEKHRAGLAMTGDDAIGYLKDGERGRSIR